MLLITLILMALVVVPVHAAEDLPQQNQIDEAANQEARSLDFRDSLGESEQTASFVAQPAASAPNAGSTLCLGCADRSSTLNPADNLLEWWDVAAQWVMAIAAVILLCIGLGQLGLSYWGVKLLRETLWHTAAATAATETAANATKTAAEAAYLQATQDRAWINIKPIGLQYRRLGPNFGLHFMVSISNTGNTPARNLIIEHGYEIMHIGVVFAAFQIDPEEPSEIGTVPHEYTFLHGVFIKPEDFKLICRSRLEANIRIRVTYQTVHSDEARVSEMVFTARLTKSYEDLGIQNFHPDNVEELPTDMAVGPGRIRTTMT